jgi:membrane protein
MSSGSEGRSRLRSAVGRVTGSRFYAVLKRAVSRFSEAEVTDRAATLAYYGFLSLFPALIVAVALLALAGSYPETYESISDTLGEAAPGPVVELVDSALRDALRDRGTAGSLLGVGLVIALVAGSGGTAAAIRALEAIEGRRGASGIARGALTRIWLMLALMGLLLVGFTALLIAGPIFSSIADNAGLGSEMRTAVSLLRWPVGLVALFAAFLLLYWRGPGGPRMNPAQYVPGAALASGLWVLASVGFSVYVAYFSSYDATYGFLGAVIVLLVWLYLGNMAFLLGGLFNAERLRPDRER